MNTIAFDPYVFRTLLPDLVGHDRAPSAFLVYLALWVEAGGPRRKLERSYQALADATGLSKSAVQGAVRTLKRRRLVQVTLARPTAVPVYEVLRPWMRKA